MKYLFSLLMLSLLLSCNNDRVLQLPEISHSEIQEILDVSPAYIFYDETKPDSVELNRKNLISTTNWLVNVDKRLTLHQAIPQIVYLQEKKRNAEVHKNEDAKNYFTCNNTSIQNLSFIEFTNVYYKLKGCEPQPKDSLYVYNKNNFKNYKNPFTQKDSSLLEIPLFFDKDAAISTYGVSLKEDDIQQYLKDLLQSRTEEQIKVTASFNKDLSFQNYITYKTFIETLKTEAIIISENEFIY